MPLQSDLLDLEFQAVQSYPMQVLGAVLGSPSRTEFVPSFESHLFHTLQILFNSSYSPFCCNFCLFHTSVHLYIVINIFLINHLPASHFTPNIHHLHRFWKLLGCLRYRFSISSLHYFENQIRFWDILKNKSENCYHTDYVNITMEIIGTKQMSYLLGVLTSLSQVTD